MECSIISPCLGEFKVFSNNSNLIFLVDVQRLRGNGKWILRVYNGAKWFSVRLRTKRLWNRFLLQLLKLQILCLFVSSKELLDIQATTECTFILNNLCDMTRVHIQIISCRALLCFIRFFHLQQSSGILDSPWWKKKSLTR